MSDMSVSHRDNQRQLEDLKQEQEQKLQKLRSDFKRREAQEAESGEAAVNHIKKTTTDRIDQAREDGERLTKRENDVIQKNYADLKRRSMQQSESLEKQVSSAEEAAKNRIAQAQKSESETLRRTQQQLREYIDNQRQTREEIRKTTNDEIEETRTKGAEKVTEARARTTEQQRNFEASAKRRLEALKNQSDSSYTEAKTQADQRIVKVRQDEAEKIERERAEKNRTLNEIQLKFKDAHTTEQREGERRVRELEHENQKRVGFLRERSEQLNSQLRVEYGSEAQRLEVEGQEDLNERQLKFDTLFKEQKIANNSRLKNLEGELQQGEIKARKTSLEHVNFEAKKLDDALKEKQHEFQQRYELSDRAGKESLQNQKESYLKALYKQKQKFDEKFGAQDRRKDDPFYQLKTFDARLTEEPNSYVLKARVPPHERESVDIIVKDDRVTLSAKRAYQSAFNSENGEKTSTNSFQTYRQDFKLDVPVEGSKAFKKIESDGSIVVIAPKKGSNPRV